jgi:phosphohistidine swiveling domain-containing protein
MLEDLAEAVRKDGKGTDCVLEGRLEGCSPEVKKGVERILEQFGDLTWEKGRLGQDLAGLLNLIMEMPSRRDGNKFLKPLDPKGMEEAFLSRFEDDQKPYALELLDLARASYRLRDDDNIYLGKIEGQALAAEEEGYRRILPRGAVERSAPETDDLVSALGTDGPPKKAGGQKEQTVKSLDFVLKSRQIVGQPAGPGMAMGKARVALGPSDLFNFRKGEILVCDAVDPTMTFVVPLASAIVERRGGMLIHGAIIAREYGIPCVTGVPDAVDQIRTGDFIAVDGHLGIVVIGEATL